MQTTELASLKQQKARLRKAINAAAPLKIDPHSLGGRLVVTILGRTSQRLDMIWKIISVSSFL